MQPFQIAIKAFDINGRLLMLQHYDSWVWTDGDGLPLLDDENWVRVKYRVHAIEGEQSGEDGSVETKWRNVYSEQGAIVGFTFGKKTLGFPTRVIQF